MTAFLPILKAKEQKKHMQGGRWQSGSVEKDKKLDTNIERTSGKSGSVEKIGFGLAQKDRKKEKTGGGGRKWGRTEEKERRWWELKLEREGGMEG